MIGFEALRFWAGRGDWLGPVTARRVVGGRPETVCLNVIGEGVRFVLPVTGDDALFVSLPNTSLRDTLGPLDATCHGEAGVRLSS